MTPSEELAAGVEKLGFKRISQVVLWHRRIGSGPVSLSVRHLVSGWYISVYQNGGVGWVDVSHSAEPPSIMRIAALVAALDWKDEQGT